MYSLSGTDYSGLFDRNFTDALVVSESSGRLANKFACHSSAVKDINFDILHFRADFQEDICIRHLQGKTHVSLHFQLNGHSDAYISGFSGNMPMGKGEFNLLNCVQPKSTFTFPKQPQYEYMCIGLKPSFFQQLLLSCGNEYDYLLEQSINERAFTLFSGNQPINKWLRANLQLLIQSPVPENLRSSYLQTKITELVILALSPGSDTRKQHDLNATDEEKIRAVKNYLSTGFLADLSLADIARKFLLNEFKLKKGFREIFGTTVFGYIHKLRMEHAYYLVCHADYSIGEIAAITGYQSDAAFIRAFKQAFNCSPGNLSKRAFR